jgi:hypothetical protein
MPKISAFAALLLLASAPIAVAQTTSPGASPPPASTSSTGGSGTTSAPGKMSTQDIQAKLESQGYSNVSDVTSTPEGTSARAMKDGKPVTLVIDAGGNVKESQARGP